MTLSRVPLREDDGEIEKEQEELRPVIALTDEHLTVLWKVSGGTLTRRPQHLERVEQLRRVVRNGSMC
jgi:hypothetical protein